MAPSKRAQVVVNDLLGELTSGRLPPGERLPTEPELSKHYAMSRSAIREAMHTLAAKGFVRVRQGSGTTVAPREEWNELDPDYVAIAHGVAIYGHLMDAREALEPVIAAIAAERIGPEQLDALHAAIDRMRDVGSADPEAHADADIAFHDTIARASGNPVLVAMHASLMQLGRRSRSSSVTVQGAVDRAVAWHEHILEALAGHDPGAASAAMRLHLRQVRTELETLGDELG